MKKYPIIVIGAGAAGLVIAVGAAKAGKRVLLIEKGEFGGDCTNYGCIPSKTLIAAARTHIDSRAAFEQARATVAYVRRQEEPEALEKIGVRVLRGAARFLDTHTVTITYDKDKTIRVKGKKIVIATGSSPYIPRIDGLQGTPFHTNETIFSLKQAPKSLAILGGGPIGCELAQTFARLGATVHIIHKHGALLPKEEICAQDLIANRLQEEGIKLHFNQTITTVSYDEEMFTLTLPTATIETESLLIAIGRKPNSEDLHLDAAQIHHTSHSIPTDRFGRTNQKQIFAIGDVRGGPYFTHLAEAQARAVLTSLLLPFPFLKKLPSQPVPRTTFTDPEVAGCGLSEKEAHQIFGPERVKTYTIPFSEIDRALCEGRTEGFLMVVTKKWSGRILGLTITGPRAGEMLPTLTLAMQHNIPLRKLRHLIFPYPTYGQAIRKAADLWLTQTILRKKS